MKKTLAIATILIASSLFTGHAAEASTCPAGYTQAHVQIVTDRPLTDAEAATLKEIKDNHGCINISAMINGPAVVLQTGVEQATSTDATSTDQVATSTPSIEDVASSTAGAITDSQEQDPQIAALQEQLISLLNQLIAALRNK